MTDTAPSGALTWESAGQRNRRLKLWRRAVFAIFGERPRAIRVAWVLTDLFNVERGYAFPTNPYLAEETKLWENKLRETLLILENGGAIIRTNVTNPATGQNQRVIYPSTAIIPRPALGQGGRSPTLGRRGEPQQPGHQNLSKRTRLPKTELERARLAAKLRQERETSERGTVMGCPSSEATGDGKGTRLTEGATVVSRSGWYAAGKLMDGGGLRAAKLPCSTPTLTEDRRQSSMLGTESAPDDGIPEFLRRTPTGADGRTQVIEEEASEWTL